MNSQSEKNFYGWKLLLVLWLIYFNMCLILYGGNVINAYMATGLNMPRDAFGLGVGLITLLGGLGAPAAAWFVKKFGSRYVIFGGTLVTGLGSLGCALWVQDPAGFTFFYGVIIGSGLAFGGLLAIQTVVSSWFSRKRSLATALLLSAGGVSGLLSANLFSYLINDAGISWQQTWLIVSFSCFMFAFIALIFIRNKPGDLKQVPDGYSLTDNPSAVNPLGNGTFKTSETWVLKQALRTRSFWFLTAGFFAMMFGYNLCIAHGVIHLMDIGVPNALAATTIGLVAITSLASRLLGGLLGDRIEPRYVFAAGLVLIAAGCFLVVNAHTPALIVIYSILIGGGMGLVYVNFFNLIANYFGSEMLPVILGAVMPFTSFGGASSAYLGGVFQVQFGSYFMIFILTAIFLMASALMMLFAVPPKQAAVSSTA